MVLKKLLIFSTLGGCGGLARADFYVSSLRGCGGLKKN